MRIGIDLDGVTYPFVPVFKLYAEYRLGRQLPEVTTWDFFTKDWGIEDHSFSEMMKDGWYHGVVFHIGSPYEGALESIKWLYWRGHDIVLCTTRPDYAKATTEEWVDRWDIPHNELILTDKKDECGLDILLDDAPHNIEAVRKTGCRPIIFNRPWNTHVYGQRITSWDQLKGIL